MNPVQMAVASIALVSAVPGKWQSHNCPCCILNGQPRPDTKKRGGLLFSALEGAVAYSCFNCGFKATWRPGMHMTKKLKDLLTSYGASTTQLMNITMMATEIKDSGEFDEFESKNKKLYESFTPVNLPDTAKPFSEWAAMQNPPAKFVKVMTAVADRNMGIMDAFDLYWSPDTENELNERFIIPFFMNDKIVGYTARHIWWGKKRMKYLNKFPTNLVYNFDLLNSKTVKDILVTEGPIDAGMVGGVATNHYNIRDNQLQHLKQCGKNIIVVPDRDDDGKKMVEQAIQNKFAVALPEWGNYIDSDGLEHPIKDVEHCARIYGRLFTRVIISKYTYVDEFEIRVRANKWFI
ncbi:hypothetical protein NVP2275O_017 [Vibrio phage 2.275.O._10N.286.54.E11]|nr:hypothetical protein NVP2275O_017 [Vibrio phage 2.275.O._10N.286.54.E11]